ncbi:MAG TPA: cytosine permease [Terrimesophilobacter sp.]|uniref:purine-cytosine permease family protein n=1 Tax=Terrimesophilobacter sp. TaxID=2906435 RepID=UPI002F91FB5C
MLDHDESAESHSGVSPFAPPGPRRSTYTPPNPPQLDEGAAADGSAHPTRPTRESVPIDLLAASLAEEASTPGNTLEVMDQLERQLRLRQKEAQEFSEWESSMLALGTPEAVAEVEDVRFEFLDVLEDDSANRPGSPTHTFRVDEAPEGELSSAPAPVTPPISDIPPPPGHAVEEPSESPATEPAMSAELAVPAESPVLHELVEPDATATPVSLESLDFDALLSGPIGAERIEPEPSEGYEAQLDDTEIDDTDRAFPDFAGPFPVTAEGVAILPETPILPAEPIASPRIPAEQHVLHAEEPSAPPAFRVEESSLEPTPTDQRIGRASRLFWLWFAANSSVVSVAFGGALLSLGMSLRQAIVAALAGVAISFLPLGLGTLAGKWSGQPTMVVSRATFGHLGNILPAVLALSTRLFWGALLLWFLAAGTARILVGAELGGALSETQLTIIGLAVGFLLALVIAFFGYGLIARIQLGLSIVSGLLVVGLVAITWPAVDITTALTVSDGPWILLVTGAVLVFSFVGLVWAVSSADLARYQRPGSSGASSMLWSTFGSTLPAFLLIAYGALLAASDPQVAAGLVDRPFDTIALLIPSWYPIPLVAALALSLLSGVVVTIYSGGFALQAIGATMRRSASVVVVGVALAAVALLLAFSVGDFNQLLRDVATSLAVPVAAWAGIFAAEMMIRNRRFDSPSLLKRGGVYPDVHWVNLAMLLVASAVGFGLTTATVGWLGWQGYLFGALGVPLSSDLAGSDLGVFVALLLGVLTPIVAGIPAIRRQEQDGGRRPA